MKHHEDDGIEEKVVKNSCFHLFHQTGRRWGLGSQDPGFPCFFCVVLQSETINTRGLGKVPVGGQLPLVLLEA